MLSFRCCIIERDKEGKRVRKKRAKNDEEKVEKTRKKKLEKKKKKNFETIYILTAESMSAASCALVLVGCGVESGLSTSHITSTSCPPRMGSG